MESSQASKGNTVGESLFIVRQLGKIAVDKIVAIYLSYRKLPEGMVAINILKRHLYNKGYTPTDEAIKKGLQIAIDQGKNYTEVGLGGRNQETIFYNPELIDLLITNNLLTKRKR